MGFLTFSHALVRKPGVNLSQGLTSANLGKPSYEVALAQHIRYQNCLERLGLKIWVMEADVSHPDCPFVEDTAIVTEKGAVLLRPSEPSRKGEEESVAALLSVHMNVQVLQTRESIEGGDVLRVGDHFFIGLSSRTQAQAADVLAGLLRNWGYTVSIVKGKGYFHLKSGLAHLGDGRLLATPELAKLKAFQGYEVLRTAPEEAHGANCLAINGTVLIPTGCPMLYGELKNQGYTVEVLDNSEFRKLDGALTCLSLLW